MILDKPALRARMRIDRDRFVAAARPAIEPPDELLALLHHGLTVASYMPIGSEADPSLLARAAVEVGCTIALPHVVDRATPLRFLAWDTQTALAAGPFSLLQPPADAAELLPDIILTPLIAFDSALNRLGQGAGYYDRGFESHAAARRIGVAWAMQQVDAVPTDDWDVPLHAVVTEQGWITAS